MTLPKNLELAVVVPTYNEHNNIVPLIDRLNAALKGIEFEIIFVDDNSADGTPELIREMAQSNRRIRILQRVGRRGLASACIEGFLATAAPVIAVMDADLQHDETLLPTMYSEVIQGNADIVIGSRFLPGASADGLNSDRRKLASRLANKLANLFLATPVTDPMSGFFLFNRRAIEPLIPGLSGRGFKILLDILLTAKGKLSIKELPYKMDQRVFGSSKMSLQVAAELVLLVVDKAVGKWIPIRFLLFVLVGMTGVVVHLSALYLFNQVMMLPFFWAQAISTLVAMTNNFFLNNEFTYKDQKLTGRALLSGYLAFCLACSLGAVINVQIAELLFETGSPWWMAGTLGAVVGAVWNYSTTSFFTWRRP